MDYEVFGDQESRSRGRKQRNLVSFWRIKKNWNGFLRFPPYNLNGTSEGCAEFRGSECSASEGRLALKRVARRVKSSGFSNWDVQKLVGEGFIPKFTPTSSQDSLGVWPIGVLDLRRHGNGKNAHRKRSVLKCLGVFGYLW